VDEATYSVREQLEVSKGLLLWVQGSICTKPSYDYGKQIAMQASSSREKIMFR